MKKAYDYLIVGAGLFGSVFAREAVEHGKKCLVIDKRQHTGGNIYCENVPIMPINLESGTKGGNAKIKALLAGFLRQYDFLETGKAFEEIKN